MWIVNSPTASILTPCAIALGNFDGIHRGHQCVLEPILTAKKDLDIYPTVVSFDPHPQEFFTGEKRHLLTPLAEKVEILENLGIEQLILLPFTAKLAALSPAEFVERIIARQCQAKCISVGEDFHFGYRRQGNAEDLVTLCASLGIEVQIARLKNCLEIDPAARISSSLIRQALSSGDVIQARRMLGRFYRLTGTVVMGQQLGRKLGFPTANLRIATDKLLPRLGVYCVWVHLPGKNPLAGVMNIGCRPTIASATTTVEVHLLDWSGDLYGQTLKVSLVQFLRLEQKFNSLDDLKARIANDIESARKILSLP